MIIRTLSQLPKTSEDLQDETLFEVSIPRDGKYISKSAEYAKIQDQIVAKSNQIIANNYGLTTNGKNINVDEIRTKVNDISKNAYSFTGEKTFLDNVHLPTTDFSTITGDIAVNADYVSEVMKNNSFCIRTTSQYDAAVAADGTVIGQDKLMKMYINMNSRSTNDVTCKYTGNLVIYGWLSDNGNVDTAASWVALEGYMNNDTDEDASSTTGRWIILSLSPWIMGQKHSNLQYVGFNVPVAEGLKVRITTGFDVNYTNSTYQNRPNSLVMNASSTENVNMTNAFVGYILH